MNKGLFVVICALVSLLLSFIWLLAGMSVISSVPGWIPPASVFALALAFVLELTWNRSGWSQRGAN